MNWRIWYNDNSVVDGSTEADWSAAPDDGVLGIAVQFGRNNNGIMLGELLIGSDWYWMYQGKLYQSGTTSEIVGDWLPSNSPEGSIEKKARWGSDVQVSNVGNEMLAWVT